MLKEAHGLSSKLLTTNYALTCVVLDEMINKGVVEHLQVQSCTHTNTTAATNGHPSTPPCGCADE